LRKRNEEGYGINRMKNRDEYVSILRIKCGDTTFEFTMEEDDCWYCLDGCQSVNGNETLLLNADREVYAVYTDGNGTKHYGTIGDIENETIEDNYPCSKGETYIFYENPRTEKYYV